MSEIEDLTPAQKDALIAQFRAADTALTVEKEERYGVPPIDTFQDNVPTEPGPTAGTVQVDVTAMLQMMANMQAEIKALKAGPGPSPVDSSAQGGPPVLHHLHLVDGTVIANHNGIATHYSYPDGTVVRVREHFPVDEPDPATINR